MKIFITCFVILASLIESNRAQTTNLKCTFDGCSCTVNTNGLHDIVCEPTSQDQLDLSYFPNRNRQLDTITSIDRLEFRNFTFKRTPASPFDGLSINKLVFSNNSIEIFAQETFNGIKYLKSLAINEKSLKWMEAYVFLQIGNDLEMLDLSSSSLTDDKLGYLQENLKYLKKMKHLSLNSNKLSGLTKEFLGLFPSLEKLELSSNNLASLDSSMFSLAPNLKALNLDFNLLSDLRSLFLVLQPLQKSLKELSLVGNSIEALADFSAFLSLEKIILSKNKIRAIKKSNFDRLNNLTVLSLAENLIEAIEPDTFMNLDSLEILLLNDNFLTTTPKIFNLKNLISLSLKNQNEHLTQIPSLAFHRNSTNSNRKLNLELDQNELKFEDSSFCSISNYSQLALESVHVSFSTMLSAKLCVWNQIVLGNSSNGLSMEINDYKGLGLTDLSKVCNCNLKTFVDNFRIKLSGACDGVFGSDQYKCSDKYVDLCGSEMKCSDTMPPTTPFISNASTETRKESTNNDESPTSRSATLTMIGRETRVSTQTQMIINSSLRLLCNKKFLLISVLFSCLLLLRI